jgi:hypothetical protein
VITITDVVEIRYGDENPCKGNSGNINKQNIAINGMANIKVMARAITVLMSHIMKI